MAELTLPGGKEKGVAISQASDRGVQWWAENAKEAPLREACAAELARRGKGGAPAQTRAMAPSAPSTHVVKPQQALAGSYAAAGIIDSKLREAASIFHLISPATSCGSLPEGCEVAISLVHVSSNTEKGGPGDVAPVGGGKLSLSGNVLKKIAAAAGIDWDAERSRRLDNGRNPHYVHFRAVGYVRLFDGTVRTVTGEVEIDMREGSPQIVAMQQRAKEGAHLDSQIRDTRLFILRHAETKAKLRAIADMGVKRSYSEAELAKPFAVARLMFTGRTQDPELRRMFADKIADSMLGGSRALYGAPQQSSGHGLLPTPAAHASQLSGHEPPPLAAAHADDDYDYEAAGEAVRTPLPSRAAPSPADAGGYDEDLAQEAKASGAY